MPSPRPRPSPHPPLLRPLACALLAACGDAATQPAPPPPAATAIQLAAGGAQEGIQRLPLRDSLVVRVTGAGGVAVPGATVWFEAGGGGRTSPATAVTDAAGYARAAWTLGDGPGDQQATARATGLPPVTVAARAAAVPPTVLAMLLELDQHIAANIAGLEQARQRNPQLAAWLDAKLALLRRPGLALDVIHDRRWAEGAVTSSDGRSLPVVAVFPEAALRAEASAAVETVVQALPLLEGFVGAPFPAGELRIWEGFTIGMSGGGGRLFMEDRAAYEARTPATRLPYEAALVHELAHSYVGHEALTQFLEVYLHNRRLGAPADVDTWAYTRNWTPAQATNGGLHALLDVYQLVGHDAMARAYHRLAALRPPYGQPLSDAARQAFVDEAPAAVRAQVAAKVGAI